MSSPDAFFLFLEKYYRAVPKTKEIEGGDIFWVPAVYLMETANALRVEWAKPGDESNVLFRLVSEKKEMLFNHTPIAHPPIRQREELLAIKGKMRPAIIMSLPNSEIPKGFREGGEFPESFVVAPVYTFGNPEEEGFPLEFVQRLREFEYHQFFYLPSSEDPPIEESFARLDRIQCVAKRMLKDRIATLTSDAFDALKNLVHFYFWGPPDPNIEAYRQIWLEERMKQ